MKDSVVIDAVHHRAANAGPGSRRVPRDPHATFASIRMADGADTVANWARYAAAGHALREVLTHLERANVQALPVKGIITASLLYDDVGERPMSDVDLRLRRRDFGRLLRVAREMGWQPSVLSPRLWQTVLFLGDWSVDVECTMGHPGLCAVTIDEMMGRARRATGPLGFPHLEPELHDHALLLVLNAFKDGLRPRPWALEDLVRIVEATGFDAGELVERAQRGRVGTALWIVASWLERETGSAGWAEVRLALGPRPPTRWVARAYDFALAHWSNKLGFVVSASASDDVSRSIGALALTSLGVVRRRVNLRRAGVRPPSHGKSQQPTSPSS